PARGRLPGHRAPPGLVGAQPPGGVWYTPAAMRRMVGLGVVVLLVGCSMTEFAANGVVRVTGRASPAVNEQWDYEFAREAVPGGIARLEGMFEVVPDNEELLLQLVRGYAAYGFA